MRTILTHRIELKPNPIQEALFRQCVGAARFAYNWALAEWQRQFEAGEKPNEAALRRQFNAIKPIEFPWILDLPKAVPQQAIKNVGRAWQRFFQKKSKFPRFKRRGVHDSARLDNGPGTFAFSGNRIRLPKIGGVRLREALRFDGKPLSATLSREADRWLIAIPVAIDRPDPVRERHATVGVDLGVSTALTLSTGEKIDSPKPLKKYLQRMKRRARQHSRKQKGSANRRQSARKLAKLHARIAHVRQDFLHQTTTALTRRFSLIGIEDLNVKGMMANDRLARAISDIGFYEFRRQLEYKAALSGGTIVVVDRWFPSSKTCSACGAYCQAMPLPVRQWTCAHCGVEHDRDINAAQNIQRVALATGSWPGSHACGEEGAGRSRKTPVKPASMKQEITHGIKSHD
ncbi:MAG: transposase [Candidatus Competibacter sp.]|nr:transposase [Candidatus Competibacter sp.]MDG4606022.1 RNA-guided endonuclease TnpB family protein [Candidatus Contendobacter sp.]HRD49595.1 RNA-guided endonuclease TnpB family protein [Candidatus Contendobacter sp.]